VERAHLDGSDDRADGSADMNGSENDAAGSDARADGIVYSVSGAGYLAEALLSARSSLRFNRVPHVIFSDLEQTPPSTDGGLPSIRHYDPSGDPFADKIANIAAAPFQRSIFLDSDTYVVGDLTHLLDLLARFDMAAALAPGYRGREDADVPVAFYEFNVGVLAWRNCDATRDFFADWLDTYERLTRERPFPTIEERYGGYEQPAFRRCAWRREIRICTLGAEYNYRPRRPGSAVERVRVVHGRYPDYDRVEAVLNGETGPRSFQAIPGGSKQPIVDLPA
jgi:hypothetical protein